MRKLSGIRAINYAKQMRAGLTIGDNGQVESGANVRVLNNSWGQPSGFDQAFQAAIEESGEQGILFVAASGNGNILGNGVNNDRTPFYPASYETENLIAVAALSASGNGLASFSNCLGLSRRESGQNRSPDPPAMMSAMRLYSVVLFMNKLPAEAYDTLYRH